MFIGKMMDKTTKMPTKFEVARSDPSVSAVLDQTSYFAEGLRVGSPSMSDRHCRTRSKNI
jgi:hypothetical protein